MGRISTRKRRTTTGDPEAGRELSSELQAALPPRFEAVGDALASGSGTVVACEVAGATLARDGLSLAEVIDSLAATSRLVRGTEPLHEETRALAVAWSDTALGYLHGLSCEDPLSGLASLAHLRSRLADHYRADEGRHSHALVVVAAPAPTGDSLTRSMRVAQLGATVRTVFTGAETISHIAPGRLVVLAPRDERIARRVSLLRKMLDGTADPHARIWIEGLPDTDEAAAALLDELARV